MSYQYEANIRTKVGGAPVKVFVYANDVTQAKKIIVMRPEFKSFSTIPKKVDDR